MASRSCRDRLPSHSVCPCASPAAPWGTGWGPSPAPSKHGFGWCPSPGPGLWACGRLRRAPPSLPAPSDLWPGEARGADRSGHKTGAGSRPTSKAARGCGRHNSGTGEHHSCGTHTAAPMTAWHRGAGWHPHLRAPYTCTLCVHPTCASRHVHLVHIPRAQPVGARSCLRGLPAGIEPPLQWSEPGGVCQGGGPMV